MSRIGKKPVPIPEGVTVEWKGEEIVVTGPKGTLSYRPHPDMKIEIDTEAREIRVQRPNDLKFFKALHGTTRQILNNMVIGVSQGFRKELEIVGTGWRARMEGNTLVLSVGYSHDVRVEPLPGVSIAVEGQNKIIVTGIDKQKVGQMAADIRAVRPPEPYKGKGIRYVGEKVRRKAGKAGVKAA